MPDQEQETFDGQEIAGYWAVLPSIKLEAPDSYQRGTYMNLNVQVRVRSVRYEEVTGGKAKGDLNKVHVLAMESVDILDVVTPAQRIAILEAELRAAQALEAAEQKQIESEGVTDVTDIQDADTWEYVEPEYPEPAVTDLRDEDPTAPIDETAVQEEQLVDQAVNF